MGPWHDVVVDRQRPGRVSERKRLGKLHLVAVAIVDTGLLEKALHSSLQLRFEFDLVDTDCAGDALKKRIPRGSVLAEAARPQSFSELWDVFSGHQEKSIEQAALAAYCRDVDHSRIAVLIAARATGARMLG
jgi:hypothetical protein